jgi:hypothetical protein
MPSTIGAFHRRNLDSRRRAFAGAHELATFLMMVFARSEAPGELHVHQN